MEDWQVDRLTFNFCIFSSLLVCTWLIYISEIPRIERYINIAGFDDDPVKITIDLTRHNVIVSDNAFIEQHWNL